MSTTDSSSVIAIPEPTLYKQQYQLHKLYTALLMEFVHTSFDWRIPLQSEVISDERGIKVVTQVFASKYGRHHGHARLYAKTSRMHDRAIERVWYESPSGRVILVDLMQEIDTTLGGYLVRRFLCERGDFDMVYRSMQARHLLIREAAIVLLVS